MGCQAARYCAVPEPRHRFRLFEPCVEDNDVVFRFAVTPPTELYARTQFRLSFPSGEVDISAVPRALWWRVMLICLHAHFAMVAPCVVELPIGLSAAEREFWERLVANVTRQREAYGSEPRPGRHAVIEDSGPLLEPVRVPTAAERSAAAFSGGKDSLVLASLLAELTDRPLLVTVTSPVPWARDHVGAARDRARVEIAKRLPVEAIEVTSDFRTCWDLGFSTRDGCTLGTHELSDLALYYGAMAAVAAARGIGSCFMASEADIQYNRPGPQNSFGRRDPSNTLLHREFLSCSVTQSALSAALEPFGIRQGSLSYPLHMPQVQGLLLRRYRHVADLQFSCWLAPPGEQACSACEKCFLVALITLSEGVSPHELGIDPVKLLVAFSDWTVEGPPIHQIDAAAHPFRRPRDQRVRALQRTPAWRVASILRDDGASVDDPRLGQALAIYTRLRAEALRKTPPPEPGYVTDFLDLVHADCRRPLESIFAQHFLPTSEPEFRAMSKRAQALAAWITAPLRPKRLARLRTRAP
jgi:hypothetical protein